MKHLSRGLMGKGPGFLQNTEEFDGGTGETQSGERSSSKSLNVKLGIWGHSPEGTREPEKVGERAGTQEV